MSKRRRGLDTEQCTTVAQPGAGDLHLGWDRASQRPDLTVIDDTGQLVDRWTLAHNEAGLHQA